MSPELLNEIQSTSAGKSVVVSPFNTRETSVDDAALRIPCYCEENVWRLALKRQLMIKEHEEKLFDYAVFISNNERKCPMYFQKAAASAEQCCIWDYHVILISTTSEFNIQNSIDFSNTNADVDANKGSDATNSNKTKIKVYDIDSTLPYPCELKVYLKCTFQHLDYLKTSPEGFKTYSPLFRVIKVEHYLKYFYSDRSHMFKSNTGTYLAPPPYYEPIMIGFKFVSSSDQRNKSNLESYITIMDCQLQKNKIGRNKSINDEKEEKEEYFGIVLDIHDLKMIR